MKATSQITEQQRVATVDDGSCEDSSSGEIPKRGTEGRFPGVVIAELVAMKDGCTPLVLCQQRNGPVVMTAGSVVDLHGASIGKRVALMFNGGDPAKPIVIGVLRDTEGRSLDRAPGHVEVEGDNERLIVSAKNHLVMQCGKARIILTKEGKIVIQGTYVLSHSSGVNRVKGGSVQIN